MTTSPTPQTCKARSASWPSSGTVYKIAVDGFALASGTVTLNWNQSVSTPPNDAFANAQVLVAIRGLCRVTNTLATKNPANPITPETRRAFPWYSWTANLQQPGDVRHDGSSFDTLLAVYTGNAVNSLTPVGSNETFANPSNLQSRVTFVPSSGTVYKIAVDGFALASGTVALNWNQSASARPTTLSPPLKPSPAARDRIRKTR